MKGKKEKEETTEKKQSKGSEQASSREDTPAKKKKGSKNFTPQKSFRGNLSKINSAKEKFNEAFQELAETEETFFNDLNFNPKRNPANQTPLDLLIAHLEENPSRKEKKLLPILKELKAVSQQLGPNSVLLSEAHKHLTEGDFKGLEKMFSIFLDHIALTHQQLQNLYHLNQKFSALGTKETQRAEKFLEDKEINLGMNSFFVSGVQRMGRYILLFDSIASGFEKLSEEEKSTPLLRPYKNILEKIAECSSKMKSLNDEFNTSLRESKKAKNK